MHTAGCGGERLLIRARPRGGHLSLILKAQREIGEQDRITRARQR